MSANTVSGKIGTEPTYTKSVFEAILAGMEGDDPTRAVYVCSDDGARIRDLRTAEALAWHPACEIMAPDSPNPLDAPWLPFPFSARQLAALMVDGYGVFIQEKYGDWDKGLDADELLTIGPLGGKAKEALDAACKAFLHAREMAPHLDRRLDLRARELGHQYKEARESAIVREKLREQGLSNLDYTHRLAAVNAAVADLGQAMKDAQAAATLAFANWRSAVVQHLLLPIEDVPAESFRCPLLRSLPPVRRAEALHQQQRQRKFEDSPAGRALWDVMGEISDVEQEIRYWQGLSAKDITEPGRRKDELKELNTRLAALNARMNDLDRTGGGERSHVGLAEENALQRQQRRLADLRAFGGDWIKRHGRWCARDQQSGAFKKLVAQERANGSRNFSEKSVRQDLCAAAEAEAESKRAGVMLKNLAP